VINGVGAGGTEQMSEALRDRAHQYSGAAESIESTRQNVLEATDEGSWNAGVAAESSEARGSSPRATIISTGWCRGLVPLRRSTTNACPFPVARSY
jgi:hypothetical protein